MIRFKVLQVLPPILLTWSFASGAHGITKIAFGSCANQDQPQPFWWDIARQEPDIFIFGGDNIYADTTDRHVFRAKYGQLGSKQEFQEFRQKFAILATWDDHDYGKNDGGAEFSARAVAQEEFLAFFRPNASPEQLQRQGIYDAKIFQDTAGTVQIILLDTRYHRSAYLRAKTRAPKTGPYVPTSDPAKTMLGKEQWEWLGQKLNEPADLRIIVSSIQFLSPANGYETWALFPVEQQRLITMLEQQSSKAAIILSGDRHFGEISQLSTAGQPRIVDFTSSGLTHGSSFGVREQNPYRIGETSTGNNWGMITIDWKLRTATLDLHDDDGRIAARHQVPF